MSTLKRVASSIEVEIASSGNLSEVIDGSFFAGSAVIMPSAWTAASIGFKVCDTRDGTFVPYYDEDGTLVQMDSPAVDTCQEVPAKLFPVHFFKLWSQDGSGSNTAQAAARTLRVMLKS